VPVERPHRHIWIEAVPGAVDDPVVDELRERGQTVVAVVFEHARVGVA